MLCVFQYGKQLLTNYINIQNEIANWGSRESRGSVTEKDESIPELNQSGDLSDSRLSAPISPARHSIVSVKRSNSSGHEHSGYSSGSSSVSGDMDRMDRMERKPSLTSAQISEPIRIEKGPVKRVSFSTTHSVIDDHGAEVHPIRHRDSITSASTDSSEDSTSSGESRLPPHKSSKFRPRLPVTTGTTKQISEMVQTSMDGSSIGSMDSSLDEWKPGVTSPVSKDVSERRKSAPVCMSGDGYNADKRHENHNWEHRDYVPRAMSNEPMSPSTAGGVDYYSQQPVSANVLSPPASHKNVQKTHSRGSSLSSVDSSDSFQGYSTTSSATDQMSQVSQESQLWDQYCPRQQQQAAAQMKSGPPVAQKPAGIRKGGRPQTALSCGGVATEKGHRRNSSRSSLESVEEGQENARGPIPVSSPVPPRTSQPPHPSHMRSLSQPSGIPTSPQPCVPASAMSRSQPNTPSGSMAAPQYPNPAMYASHGNNANNYNAPTSSSPQISGPMSPVSMSMTQSKPSYPAPTGPNGYNHNGPHHNQQHPYTPNVSYQQQVMTKGPVSSTSAPAASSQPTSQSQPHSQSPPIPLLPAIGCMSPRLSGHRMSGSGAKPVAPPVVPCTPPTPPALVPPVQRNPITAAKTHKKRPSGGGIVVNGGNAEAASQHDIVGSPRTNVFEYSDNNQNHGDNDRNYAPLPFMSELNQHLVRENENHLYQQLAFDKSKQPPNVLPKPDSKAANTNGNHVNYSNSNSSSQNSSQDLYSVCSSPTTSNPQQQSKRHVPPPPPKRSESTKLSASPYKQSHDSDNVSVSSSENAHYSSDSTQFSSDKAQCLSDYVPNQSVGVDCTNAAPVVYNMNSEADNDSWLLDPMDLPPPPPELLENLDDGGSVAPGMPGSGGQAGSMGVGDCPRGGKVPPPPPPRKTNQT